MNSPTVAPPTRAQLRARRARRAALFGFFFGLSFSLLRGVASHTTLSPALKIAFALLFALTLALCVWQTDSALLSVYDELEKKIRSDASAIAFPLSLGAILFLGVLDLAGLPLLQPFFYWLPPVAIYGLALVWSKRRYS